MASTTFLPDPAAEIAALPPGATWQAAEEATYQTNGVELTKPVTLQFNGATFFNPASGSVVGAGLDPLIRIKDTSDVILDGPTLDGALTGGTGRETRWMVGEAGIEVLSSVHVQVLNAVVNNVWGDGMTLGFQPRKPPNSDINVDGLTINGTGGIRQGITISYVDGAVFDNVTIGSGSGVDFESDLQNVGAANVVFTNYAGSGGVRMISALNGPVTFNNPRYTGNLTLINAAANSSQQVTFLGGHLYIKRNYFGTPPAGIWVKRDEVNFPGPGAATLTLKNVAVDRVPGNAAVNTGAWAVTGGGHLILDQCCIDPPLGSNDAASTVTIIP
jgi:hypothetical protein